MDLRKLIVLRTCVPAVHAQQLLHPPLPGADPCHHHNQMDGTRDHAWMRAHARFFNEAFQANQCLRRRVSVDRGDATGMTGIPAFQ